jgi:hypothetical protein
MFANILGTFLIIFPLNLLMVHTGMKLGKHIMYCSIFHHILTTTISPRRFLSDILLNSSNMLTVTLMEINWVHTYVSFPLLFVRSLRHFVYYTRLQAWS